MVNHSSTANVTYDQCYFFGHPADYSTEYSRTYTGILVFNALITLPTIFGNFVIILGIWSSPSLHTVSNILLVGLAFSDLGVGFIVPALNIARIVPKLQGTDLHSWCPVQVAYTVFGVMFCGVSFLTVAAFTIDKYVALHWHLRYVTIVTSRRVSYLVTSFWVIFGAMSTIQIWSMTAYRISVCVVVPLFLIGTSFTYINIYKVLRRHKMQIQNQSQAANQHHGSYGNAQSLARYRRSLTGMFSVYCLFLLCYLPYICVQFTVLVYSLSDSNHDNVSKYGRLYLAVDLTETIVIMNSMINPLIYCWRMREIRRAAKEVLLMFRCQTAVQPIVMVTSRTCKESASVESMKHD